MKVSIIVPVYNVEKYLKRCMESLLAQTLQEKEIILVDDGSADGSGAMCDAYAELPGVKVIHQENAGLGMARNTGMVAAGGEYIMFVDSDDYVGRELTEHLYQVCEKQGADICISGFRMVYPDGRQKARPCVDKTQVFTGRDVRQVLLNTVGALPEDALDSKYGATACARLYRRKIVRDFGIRFLSEREMISEDLLFNLAFLSHAGRAAVITDTAYFYCTNENSLSKRHRGDRFAQDCKLALAVREILAADFEEQEFTIYWKRLLTSRARFDMIQEVVYHDRVDRQYPLRASISAIVHNEVLQEALRDYPWYKLPGMQGIFAFMMKRKQTGFLIWLIRIKQRFMPGNQKMG